MIFEKKLPLLFLFMLLGQVGCTQSSDEEYVENNPYDTGDSSGRESEVTSDVDSETGERDSGSGIERISDGTDTVVETPSDTGADSDSDADTDSDSDSDSDADTDSDSDSDTDTDSDGDTDTDTDTDSDTDGDSDSADICVSIGFPVERLPVRLMIALDRSGSMSFDAKWDQALAAIENMTMSHQDEIDFGLDLYSINVLPGQDADNGCDVNEVVNTDTAPHNAEAIMAVLNSYSPGHATPLWAEIDNFKSAAYAPTFMGSDGEKYLLIVSDGKDNCGIEQVVDGPEGATLEQFDDAVSLNLTTMDLKTIVIGFGDGVEPDQLNTIAAAGGTEFDTYLDAADGTELDNTMSAIAERVAVSCTFDIGEQDPDTTNLDFVNVRFDGEAVPRDDGCASNIGWRWADDARTTIELCEQACNTLKQGTVAEVKGEIACREQDVVIVI